MADFRPQGLALGFGSETSPTQLSDGLGRDRVSHSSRPEITGYDGMVCSLRNAPDNYRRLGLKTCSDLSSSQFQNITSHRIHHACALLRSP